MDLGLGAFIEKFEEHYGPQLTRAILALVGVTITAFCLSTIYKLLLKPAWKAMNLVFPVTGAIDIWFNVVGLSLVAWWSLMAGSKTVDAYRERKLRLMLEDFVKRAENAQREYQQLKDDFVDYKDAVTATFLIADTVLDAALENDVIDRETFDQLRSLVDTVPERPL